MTQNFDANSTNVTEVRTNEHTNGRTDERKDENYIPFGINAGGIKICGGGGGGAIFEPKTLSMYLKKKKEKKMTEPGLEPPTSGLGKPALLSTRLNTIIGITKYEWENYNIQTAII